MANITLDGLPAKTGTISDSGVLHLRESGVDKKVTVSAFLSKISAQYQTFMNTFLGTADKAAARAALDIARRTAVSNADYTILVTDKVVAQTGIMTAARVFTLPSAALYPAGEELIISDQSFTVNQEFKITISRAGSDIFNDANTSIEITQKGAIVKLVSDGISKWTILLSGNTFANALFSNRNAIINGDFNIWQRGTSTISSADGIILADRWVYGKSGAMVHDVSRSTDVPSVAQAKRLFNYSILIDCQTIDASIGATDYCILEQRIEGFNYLPLAQQEMTLSFWVKATKTGIYNISLRNSTSDRAYVSEYTINSSDVWEYKTIKITASPSTGTWNYNNGTGIVLTFTLACGSNFQTTANSWQTVSDLTFGTSNQVNACDNVANNFKITGVQLEAGSVATPFEKRLINQELLFCQRYFEILGGLNANEPLGQASSGSTTIANAVIPYKVEKRATPTITFSASNKFRFNNGTSNYVSTAVSASDQTTKTFIMAITTSGMVANTGGLMDTVDATGTISISSEL